MNIILNHKHDVEIQSQLNIANRLARTRTVDNVFVVKMI